MMGVSSFNSAFLCVGFTCAMPSLCSAQTSPRIDETTLVQAFIGHCLQNIGDIERTKAAAAALKYLELPDSLAPLLAPADPTADFWGWVALNGTASEFLLGVSRSLVDGEVIEACSVSVETIDANVLAALLSTMAQLGAPDEDVTEVGQRYRIWFTEDLSTGSYVTLLDGVPMGLSAATLGVAAHPIN